MPDRSRLAFSAAFVALLVLGYGHTLGYPYHYDDFSSIRDNPVLRSADDLGAIWRFRPSRVVVHLSLAWNLALADTPAALRLANVLIHAATSLLVGWIAAQLCSQFTSPVWIPATGATADRIPPAGPGGPRRERAARAFSRGRSGRGSPRAVPG